METLTITKRISQHTPLLHFQSDAAVPIRATELKPKLDKYIIANYNGTIPDEWIIKGANGSVSLNYKLRIRSQKAAPARCQTDKRGKPIIPMFFGEGKTAITVQGSVSLVLFCFNKRLHDYLDKEVNWSLFFLSTNFGTRQDKGYGSFYLEVNPNYNSFDPQTLCGATIKTESNIDYRIDSFFTVNNCKSDWNGIMTHISDVYKCLRGGINEHGLYFKSLMFSFARDAKTDNKPAGLYWDKRMVKELFYPKILKDQFYGNQEKDEALQKWTDLRTKRRIRLIKHPESDALRPKKITQKPYLFRDYLGLSTSESWKIPYNKTITKKSKEIARFKSPILFKPIYIDNCWYIFLLHREIPFEFKRGKFTVSDTNIKHYGSVDVQAPYFKEYGEREKRETMVPYPHFLMSDFINFVLTVSDYGRSISLPNGKNRELIDRGKSILNDLECLKKHFVRIGN